MEPTLELWMGGTGHMGSHLLSYIIEHVHSPALTPARQASV